MSRFIFIMKRRKSHSAYFDEDLVDVCVLGELIQVCQIVPGILIEILLQQI